VLLVRGQFSGARHFKESHLKYLLHVGVCQELIRIRHYEDILGSNCTCKPITHFSIVDKLSHIFNTVVPL